MKKIILLAGIAAFGIAGCQTTNTGETLGSLCRAATLSLNVASNVKPRLSMETIADVQHGVSIVDPFCSQDTPPALDTLAQIALTVALTELLTEGQANRTTVARAQAQDPTAFDWPSIREAWKAAVVRWNAA